MSSISNTRVIEKVVRELLEVLRKQRERYIGRMVEDLYRLGDDAEDVLEYLMKELNRIEYSVGQMLRIPSLIAVLIGSWFYAVLIEAEDLIEELYKEVEAMESDEEV